MVHDRFLQRVGVWSGLGYISFFGVGWLALAWFFPPIAPTADASHVAQRYADHHGLLMLAAVAMMGSTVMLLPLGALVLQLVHKIEGGVGMLTLMTGFMTPAMMAVTFYAGLSFEVAAFRSDRLPDVVQAFDDQGFLQFIGGTPLFLPLWVILAYAILVTQRRTGREVFPRWVGYVSLLVVVCYLPEGLVFILKSGPFAWNGVIGFWIPAALLIGYLAASPVVLKDATRRAFG